MTSEHKGKNISFRANARDIEVIEEMKKEFGEGIRKVTDADVLREGLISLTQKKYTKKVPSDVAQGKYEIIGGIPHIDGIPQAEMGAGLDLAKGSDVTRETIDLGMAGNLIPMNEAPKMYHGNAHVVTQAIPGEPISETSQLSKEQIELGYRMIKGELCDKDGYPVEELSGDYVQRGGQVYVTDPGRATLKETAAANSSAILGETPYGTANPALANFLSESPHSGDGMLTVREGVDEEFIGEEAEEETDYLN